MQLALRLPTKPKPMKEEQFMKDCWKLIRDLKFLRAQVEQVAGMQDDNSDNMDRLVKAFSEITDSIFYLGMFMRAVSIKIDNLDEISKETIDDTIRYDGIVGANTGLSLSSIVRHREQIESGVSSLIEGSTSILTSVESVTSSFSVFRVHLGRLSGLLNKFK